MTKNDKVLQIRAELSEPVLVWNIFLIFISEMFQKLKRPNVLPPEHFSTLIMSHYVSCVLSNARTDFS